MTENEIRAEAIELLRQFHTSSRHVMYVANLARMVYGRPIRLAWVG